MKNVFVPLQRSSVSKWFLYFKLTSILSSIIVVLLLGFYVLEFGDDNWVEGMVMRAVK